jgi:type IV pilus assembly protein PilY1
MKSLKNHTVWIATGFAWAVLSGAPAFADDTELFVGTTGAGAGTQPNILFIIDTSGSMDDEISTQEPYDPSTTYAGSCTSSRVYWSTTSQPPTCGSSNYFGSSYMACNAAVAALAAEGFYTDRMAMYDAVADSWWDTAIRWERFSNARHTDYVECETDNGVHGNGVNAANVYIQNGDTSNLWTSNAGSAVVWGSNQVDRDYYLFDSNYVNWYYGTTVTQRKIDIVKDVATDLINSVSGVNVGLMRFNQTEGGPVIKAVSDIATSRTDLVTTIDSLNANGWTPLSETLYEAGLYFRGAGVDYGNQGPPNSVAASRAGASGTPQYNTYRSPIEFECQKNFIVLLTDGLPTQDTGAASKIKAQPGYASAVTGGNCSSSVDGICLDEAAAYLYNADLIDDATLADDQNVVTYTIGFDTDFALLEDTATAGGGAYYTANDTATLTTALTNIVTSILDTQTTFSAPTVSVNSFNRTRNLNDLFVAVFRPGGTVHWPGNLKKYRLDPTTSEIVDVNDVAAVDPTTGFFKDTAQSFWSAAVDGDSVPAGGAANELPTPATRNVYTYMGVNSSLTNATNAVSTANALLDVTMLGIGSPGDPTVAQVIAFARGADVDDADNDGNVTESRNEMGDPLHAQPVTVIYGGTTASPDIDDAAVFFATNDGYMHAIDPATGQELWAFIPPDFLPDLADLYTDEPTANKHYGIDGNPTLQIVGDKNGIIEAGEKVYLFFGMRRGGTFYYALDVTDKTQPKFLWKLDTNTLAGLGQTWSSPIPTKMLVGTGSGQNTDKLVLVFGGGYDVDQDGATSYPDNVGNALYIVDSVTGSVLWYQEGTNGVDSDFPDLEYSFPSDIKVVDMDSDGYADRMYAADMGGQVWRFDVWNGQAADALVTGGVIAQLGAAGMGTPTALDSRRFYYAPDVALVSNEGQTWVHIGIGSGHRAHPNATTTQDRFYALRDYMPFAARTQADYDLITPITDADLTDVTDDITTVVPAGGPGWRFELRTGGGWAGEKVLAEARTFNNQVYFTSFSPDTSGATGCTPRLGTNRLYVLDIFNGGPVTNLDGSVDEVNLTETDRYQEFNGSISSEVVFLFPSPDDESTCVGDECTPPPVACVDLFCFNPDFPNNPVRTFWSQESTY